MGGFSAKSFAVAAFSVAAFSFGDHVVISLGGRSKELDREMYAAMLEREAIQAQNETIIVMLLSMASQGVFE